MSSLRTPNQEPISKRPRDEAQNTRQNNVGNKRPEGNDKPVNQSSASSEQPQYLIFAQFQQMMVELKAARHKAVLQNVTDQLERGNLHLLTLINDTHNDLAKYEKIMSLFKSKIPADQLRQQIKLVMDELESDWQKQQQIELAHNQTDLSLINLLTNMLTTEILPLDLIQANLIYDQQLTQLRTATLQRKTIRDDLRLKIANQVVKEPRFVHFTQAAIQASLNDAYNNTLINQFPQDPPEIKIQSSQPTLTNSNLFVQLGAKLLRAGSRERQPVLSSDIKNKSADYTQERILQQINAYLSSQNQRLLSLDGHCHGLGVSWLLMNDWDLGGPYDQMRKTIANYPTDQLHEIASLIYFFLELIDTAQRPDIYSNNTCTQQDITTLMGNVNDAFSFEGYFTKKEFQNELLQQFSGKNKPMISIQGFGIFRDTSQAGGHTMCIFTNKDSSLKFFDASDNTYDNHTFNLVEDVIDIMWKQLFEAIEPIEKPRFIVTAVQSQPKPALLKRLASLLKENLVDAIIASPVEPSIDWNYQMILRR